MLQCVGDQQRLAARLQRLLTQGRSPVDFAHIDTHGCLEPLAPVIDKADDANGSATQLRSQQGYLVKGVFRGRVQHLVIAQRFQPRCLR